MGRARLTLPFVVGGAMLVIATTAVSAGAGAAVAASPVGAPIVGLRHSTSSNWSGYAAYNQTFSSVSATWTQPSVSCGSQNTYSAFWAGLDGYNSNSVEQTGTEADCSNGAATYYSWYEMYPHPSYYAGVTVVPGHSYTATVSYSGGVFTLTLTDNSQSGNSFTTRQRLNSAKRTSAEAIVEAPYSGGILPLANFGTANFSASYANGAKSLGSFSPLDRINMSDPNGGTATPGSISTSTGAFSVTYGP
jgi:hypothetical protein